MAGKQLALNLMLPLKVKGEMISLSWSTVFWKITDLQQQIIHLYEIKLHLVNSKAWNVTPLTFSETWKEQKTHNDIRDWEVHTLTNYLSKNNQASVSFIIRQSLFLSLNWTAFFFFFDNDNEWSLRCLLLLNVLTCV